LCGEQLETLKRDGSAGVFLKHPIVIGRYPSASGSSTVQYDAYAEYAENWGGGDDGDGNGGDECYDDYDNWSVTVHLFRLDQNKCCCIHASSGNSSSSSSSSSGSCYWMTGFDYPAEHVANRRSLTTCALRFVGLVNSTPSVPILELDQEGKLLERRIQELDRYRRLEERHTYQGIKWDVHLNCFIQEQQQQKQQQQPSPSSHGSAHPDGPSARTVVLEFGEVRLTALRVDSGDDETEFTHAYAHHHGVTLPHLLGHLKGWEQDEMQTM
jgi:hypothetical protein